MHVLVKLWLNPLKTLYVITVVKWWYICMCKSFLGDGDVGDGESIQMVFKILMEWGKKLAYSLADLPRMLWNLLPDG